MSNRKDLPSEKSPNFNQRLRETLQTYLGRQGDQLDRGLTLRDLVESGLAAFRGIRGDSALLLPGKGLIDLIEQGADADLTPPPTPTDFRVDAGISYVFAETGNPTFRQGHGYLRTRLYGVTRISGAPLPVFSDAVEIAQFTGTVYAHATNPATTWHLWAKWETVDGVLSVIPAGGTNGLAVTTGQDVKLLLDALAGQITASQLFSDLGSRIDLIDGTGAGSVNARIAIERAERLVAEAQEQADRLAGIAAEALARAQGDANEASARTLALAQEAATRSAELAAETQARVNALTAETNARNAAIAQEAAARVEAVNTEAIIRARQIGTTAEGLLRAVVGAEANRLTTENTVAIARQTLTERIVEGELAEAAARTALAAKVDENQAILVSEQLTRATADAAMASDISALSVRTGNNEAGILAEQQARTTAIAAEATQRNLLATQFRGDYTGNDINAVTSGLIFQERTARSNAVSGLAQQITLLSAGAGEQFDWAKIWYFDGSAEGWTGDVAPTVSGGWLRPGNSSAPTVTSPAALGINAAMHNQIRVRVRKHGTLTWAGVVSWAGGSVTVPEPTYDVNGVGLLTVNPTWSGTINALTLGLFSAQSEANWHEIDWVAIGRPAPGASSAQLYEEQYARATADASMAADITTLTASLGAANALITNESTTRAAQDAALTTQINSLQTSLNGVSAAVTNEASARSTADAAEASSRESLSVALVGAPTANGLTVDTLSSGLLLQERNARVTADQSLTSQVTTLGTSLGTLSSTVTTVQESVSTLTNSTAQSITTLTATDQNLQGQINQEVTNRTAAIATAQQSLTAYVDAGISAEAAQRLALASTVGQNTSAINQEATTRSTQDSALSTRIDQVVASVNNVAASVLEEANARADADGAAAGKTLSIVAAAERKGDPKTAEGLLRAVLAGEAEVQRRAMDQATIQQSLTTEIKEGLSAEAAARFALTARMANNEAALVEEKATRATSDEAVTTAMTALIAQTAQTANAAIVQEQAARTTAISAETSARQAQIAALDTEIGQVSSTLVTDYYTKVGTDSAITNATTALASTVASNQATALQNYYTKAGTDGVVSSATTALKSQMEGPGGSVGGLSSALVNDYYTKTQVDGAIGSSFNLIEAKTRSRINLCPDVDKWTLHPSVSVSTGQWGKVAVGSGTGTFVMGLSPQMVCEAGVTYTITGDSLRLASGGVVYFDLEFISASGQLISDGPQAVRYDTHDFSETNSNRDLNAVAVTAPTGAVRMQARFVQELASGVTALGFRQVKVERGALPPTPYTLEGQLDAVDAEANARVVDLQQTRIGYCTIGGRASDHVDRASCEAASGVWNVGLPMATAVKQVSVTDANGNSAALEQAFTAQKTLNDGFKLQYSVKLDDGKSIAGFGLYNDTGQGSAFGIRADRFWFSPPVVVSATAPTTNLFVGKAWLRSTDNVTLYLTRYTPGVETAWTPRSTIGDAEIAQYVSPIVLQSTPTTINGVDVPPGLYVRDAYIQNGTISNAKIGNAAIDDAKVANLSAAKLTAGDGTIGNVLKSANHVAGLFGWRVAADGNAEFNNATFRGTVYASAGSFTGAVTATSGSFTGTVNAGAGSFTGAITATSGAIGGFTIRNGVLTAGSFTGYEWPMAGLAGMALSPSGILFGNFNDNRYVEIRQDGRLSAPGLLIENGAATFGGALSAATGTFKGSLTADAINAVNTINLANQAVTIPVSAYTAGSISYGAVGGLTNIQTCAINSTGAPILVIASSGFITVTSGQSVEIHRNGTMIYRGYVNGNFSAAILDTPGAGTHAYSLLARFVNGPDPAESYFANHRTIALIEVKR